MLKEPAPRHNPLDSLTYLRNNLDLRIGVAQEDIAGVNLPDPPDDDDLPDHLKEALELLDHAKDILKYEADLHRANTVTYSTGQPTHMVEEQPAFENDEDEVAHIYFQDVHSYPYPDGRKLHPLARKDHAKN